MDSVQEPQQFSVLYTLWDLKPEFSYITHFLWFYVRDDVSEVGVCVLQVKHKLCSAQTTEPVSVTLGPETEPSSVELSKQSFYLRTEM